MTSFFKWTAILFFIFVIFLKQCFANILQKNFRGDHLEEKFAIVTSSTNNKPIYKREVSFSDKNAKHKAPDVINKKNLVLFRDSNNKVIATLRDPRTWNSANVTLSKIDDYKRLQQELRSLAIFKNTISFPMEKKKEKDYINVPNKKHHIIHIAKHLAAKKVQNNKQIEKKLLFYDKDKKVNTTSKHLRSRNNYKVSLSKHDDYKRHQQEIDRVSIKGEQRQDFLMQENHPIKTKGFYVSTLKNSLKDKIERSFIFDKNYESDKKNHFYKKTNNFENYDDGLYDSDQLSYNDLHNEIQNSKTRISNDADPDNEVQSSKNIDEVEELDRDKIERLADEKNDFFPKRDFNVSMEPMEFIESDDLLESESYKKKVERVKRMRHVFHPTVDLEDTKQTLFFLNTTLQTSHSGSSPQSLDSQNGFLDSPIPAKSSTNHPTTSPYSFTKAIVPFVYNTTPKPFVTSLKTFSDYNSENSLRSINDNDNSDIKEKFKNVVVSDTLFNKTENEYNNGLDASRVNKEMESPGKPGSMLSPHILMDIGIYPTLLNENKEPLTSNRIPENLPPSSKSYENPPKLQLAQNYESLKDSDFNATPDADDLLDEKYASEEAKNFNQKNLKQNITNNNNFSFEEKEHSLDHEKGLFALDSHNDSPLESYKSIKYSEQPEYFKQSKKKSANESLEDALVTDKKQEEKKQKDISTENLIPTKVDDHFYPPLKGIDQSDYIVDKFSLNPNFVDKDGKLKISAEQMKSSGVKSNKSSELKENTSKKPSNGLTKGNESEPLTNSIENTLPTKSYENGSPTKISIKFHVLDGSTGKSKPIKELVIPIGSFTSKISQEIPDKDEVLIQLTKVLLKLFAKSNNKLLENKDISTASKEKLHQKENQTDILQTLNLLKSLSEKPDVEEVYKQSENKENEIQSTDLNKYLKSHDINNDLKNAIQSVLKEMSDERSQSLLLSKIDKSRNNPVNRYASYKGPDMESTDDDTRNNALDLAIKIINSEIKKNFDWKKQKNIPQILRDESINDESPFVRKNAFNNNQTSSNDNVFYGNENNNKNDYLNRNKNKNDYLNRNENKNDYLNRNNTFDIYNNSNKNAEDFLRSGKNTFLTNDDVKNETSKMLTNIKEMGKQDNVPTNVIVDPLSTSFNSAKNADPRGKTSEVKNERNLTVQKFNEFLPSYKNEILRSSEQKYIQPKYNKKVNTYSYLEKNNNDFKSIKKSILKVTGVIQPSEYEFHDGSHLENASKFTKDLGETLNTMPLLNQKNLFFSDCSCDSCPCKLGKKVINENSIRRQATTMSSYDDEKMMSSRSSFENVQPTSSPYFMTTKSLLDFSKQTLDEPCFGDFCEQKSCVSPPCYNQEEQCLSPPCSFPGTDWKVSHMSYGSACLCLDGKGNCSCHTDKETPKFSSYSSRPPVTLSPLCNSPPCIQQANSYSNCANYPCQFQSYFNIPLSCTNAPCQNNQNAITQNTGLQNAITQNAGMQNAIVQSPGNFRCSSSPCQQNDFSSQCYGTQCSSPPNFSTNCFSPQNFYSPCSLPQKYNNYNKDFTNHPQNCGNGIPCISSSANYFNNYENSYGNLPNFYQSPCTNTVCCNNSPCLNDQFKDKKNKNKNKESENDDNSINLKIENTYSQEDTTTKSPTRRPTRKVLIVFAPTQPPKIIYAPPPAPPPPIYSVQAPKTIYKTVSIATTPITNQIQVQPIATNYQPSTSSPRIVNVAAEPMVTKPVYVIRYINRVPQPSKPKIVVNNRKVPQRIVTAPMAAEKIVKKPLQSYQFKRPSFYRGSNRLSNYQNNINTEYNRRPVSINRYSNRNTGKLTTRPTSVNRYSNRVPSELNTRPTSINRYSNRPPSETSTPYEYNPLSKYSRKLNALRQKNRFRNNLRPTNSTVDQDSLNYEENPNYFNPTKYQKSINKFPVKYPFKNKLQGSNNDPSNDPENSLLSSSFVHTKQRNLENEAEEEEGTVFDSEDVFESNSVDGNSSKDKSSSQSVLELAKNKKFRNQLKSMKGNDNIEKLVKGITNHARNSGAIPMSDIEERISDLLAEAIVSAKQTSGSKKYNENGFKKKVNPLSEFFENGLVRHNIASRLSNYFSYASKGHSNSEHKELLQNQKSNVNKITIKKNDLNSKIDSLNAYSTLFKNLTSGNIEKAIGAKRSKTITKNEISKQNLFGFPSSNNKLLDIAKINSSSKVLVAKSLQNGNNGFTKNPKLNFKVPNLRLKSQNPVVTSKQLPTAFISQKTKLKPIVKNAFKINQRFNQNPQLSFSLKIDKNSNQQIKNTSKMEIKKTYQKAKDRYPENNFRIKSSQYTINNFNTQTVNRLKFKPTKKDLRALHPISTQVLKFILPLKNNNYLSLSKNDNRFSPGIKSQKYIFSNKQPQKKLNSTQIINIRNPLRNSNTGKIIREPQINFYAQKSKKKPLSISKAVQLKKTPNHTLDTVKAIHIPKYRLDAPKIMSTPQQNLHAIKIKKGTEKVLKQQPIFMSPMNIEKTNWLLFSKNHSSSASNKNDSTNINKKLSGLTKNKVLKLPYSLKFTKMRENLKTEKIHKNPKYLESKKLLALSPQAVAMLAFADELDKKNENELNLKKVWEDKNKMQQAILKKYKDKLFQSKEGSLKKKENDSVRDVHKNIHIEYNNLIRNIQNKTNYLVTNHLPKYIEMEFEATTAAQRRIAYPTMRELKRMVINFHNKNSIKNMLEIERKIQDVTNSLAKYNQPTPSGSHKAKAKIKKKMPKELLNKQNNVSNKNKIETPFTPTRLISNWFLWNNYLSKLEKQNPSRTIKLKDS
ncbi:protein PF3D7_1417600 isoform X4 [Hydra vulgaris]|uniref:Protein PF3D7_1417600 isoform X4 n=1 Tax=Hydra vulgaris TaxID=6087 RepID=A0ABM4BQV5_HYDVU